MATNLVEALRRGSARSVQCRGEITLPQAWRDAHDVEQGDAVVMFENAAGNLEVIPPEDSPAHEVPTPDTLMQE